MRACRNINFVATSAQLRRNFGTIYSPTLRPEILPEAKPEVISPIFIGVIAFSLPPFTPPSHSLAERRQEAPKKPPCAEMREGFFCLNFQQLSSFAAITFKFLRTPTPARARTYFGATSAQLRRNFGATSARSIEPSDPRARIPTVKNIIAKPQPPRCKYATSMPKRLQKCNLTLAISLPGTYNQSMNPVGHPDGFNPERAARVCDLVAAGARIDDACNRDDTCPTATFYDWKDAHPELSEQYARARERQGIRDHDHVQELADTTDDVNYNARREQIKAYIWLAGVRNKRFSPKMDHTTNGEKIQPLQIVVQSVDTKQLIEEIGADDR